MFKKFKWSLKAVFKMIGLILGGLIGLALLIALLHFSYKTVMTFTTPLGEMVSRDSAGESGSFAYTGGAGSKSSGVMAPISIIEPRPGFPSGTDAEAFEVKNYYATIASKNLDQDCQEVMNLKSNPEVIFESSNHSEENCYFRFKVVKGKETEIVTLIKAMKPRDFGVNIYTIQTAVEGVQNELEILNKKLQSIEETLTNAQTAYDQITVLATDQNNPDALAKIIDSKLNLIERLSTERMNLKAQIDNYNKMNADQLDQLNYTFFDLNFSQDVVWDWKQIKLTWQEKVKEMVQSLNMAFQTLTLGLVTYAFYMAVGVLYLLLTVFLLKFVWRGVKRIWNA